MKNSNLAQSIAFAYSFDSHHNLNSESYAEAFSQLVGLVGRKSPKLSAEFLAAHVLNVTPDLDWPVRRAAMEAVLRRLSFAQRDKLKIANAPKGTRLGSFETKNAAVRNSKSRPYQTIIKNITPFVGSCNCEDFISNSLGLCKHLLTVLEEIFKNDKKVQLAVAEQGTVAEKINKCSESFFLWNPVKPATGIGDPLSRIYWRFNYDKNTKVDTTVWTLQKAFSARVNNAESSTQPADTATRHTASAFAGEYYCLADAQFHNPQQRLILVQKILALHTAYSKSKKPHREALKDSALVALLKREEQRLTEILRISTPKAKILAALKSLKKPLFPYQIETVERFFAVGKLLLADDMGLGKTAQSIAVCHTLWQLNKVRRGLLIVPAALKSQWMREWNNFTDAPVKIVEGNASERAAIYQHTKKGFLIANYEQVMKDFEAISLWEPEIIALDEAQRIKNWETKTSAYVKGLTPMYRLVLTGTPFENRIEELASVLDWVDRNALEPKWRLGTWHSIFVDGKRESVGARNLNVIRERIANCTVRRVRQEVIKQLPKRTDTRVDIEVKEEQRVAHDEFMQPIAQIIAISKKRPLMSAEFLRLMTLLLMQRQICNGIELHSFDGLWLELSQVKAPTEEFLETLRSPKLVEFRRIVSELVFNQGRKIVVFSQWRKMILLANWAISGLLAENNCRAVFFTGQEKEKRRTQNIVEFHDDPAVPIMFLSDAGGVGLNLQRAASCCINLEMPWNPAVLEQRIGRIYRLGQTEPVQIFNLISSYGIESRIADLVTNKQAVFKGLFDGTSNEVVFENNQSFLAQIQKIVEPHIVPIIKKPAFSEAEVEDDAAEDVATIQDEQDLQLDCQLEGVEESAADGTLDREVVDAVAKNAQPAANVALNAGVADVDLVDTAADYNDKLSTRSVSDDTSDTDDTQQRSTTASPSATTPAALFAKVKFEKHSDGSLNIHAPADAAQGLVSMFEGMAQLFRGMM